MLTYLVTSDLIAYSLTCSLTYLPTNLLTHSLTYLPTYLLTHKPTHSLTHLPPYLLTYSLTCLLTYLLTHSLTSLPTYLLTYLLTYLPTADCDSPRRERVGNHPARSTTKRRISDYGLICLHCHLLHSISIFRSGQFEVSCPTHRLQNHNSVFQVCKACDAKKGICMRSTPSVSMDLWTLCSDGN